MSDQAVEKVGVHQRVLLRLDGLREFLEDLHLEVKQCVVLRLQQLKHGSGDLLSDGDVLGGQTRQYDLEDVKPIVEVRLRLEQLAIGDESELT